MTSLNSMMATAGFAALAVAAAYILISLVAVLVWRMQSAAAPPAGSRPAGVTILKPLCGNEPGLYDQLRSFCLQDHPEFQLVFGVRDPADSALKLVAQLIREFPAAHITVVSDPRLHGSNFKTSNLINMLSQARHDVLTIADSDVRVRPDYLARVTAPLLDAKVGLVTCIHHDVPTPAIWARLGAMYINEWYMPSVLLAWLFGHRGYASGQTLCLRRETLERIGGFESIANQLADDYRLGELIRQAGLRIVLYPYEVRTTHDEVSFRSMTQHELRWMRTIRALRPWSFPLLFLSFGLPLACAGLLLTAAADDASGAAWSLLGLTLAARLAIYGVHRLRGRSRILSDLWLIPVRDFLIAWVWFRSLFVSRVSWRGTEYEVDARGDLHRVVSP